MSRPAVVGRRGLPASAGVAAPADRRFRRAEVRPGRRRRLAQTTWRVLRIGLPVAVLAGGVFWAATAVTGSALFSVRQVHVEGNGHLSTAEVEAALTGLRGTNILHADLERYRRQLLDSPWVASVTLGRVLPSTIDVRIVERTPMAVARLGQQLYLVDDAGTIIDEFGPQYAMYDLPIVDGLISAPQKGLPVVEADRVRLTSRFLLALAGHDELRRRISQIDVSNARDLLVMLVDGPAWLRLGDDQFVERLTTYLELAPTLDDQFTGIDYVDLRFGDHVAVGARRRATTPGDGR